MKQWVVTATWDAWWLNLVEDDRVVKVHPIPFDNERDAARAAARLNVRDELIA